MKQYKATIRFSAKLHQAGIITLPKSVSAKIQLKNTMIEGIINSFPFRAPLEFNKGSHTLKISKAIKDAAKANAGDTLTIEITRVGEEPETRIPIELKKALKDSPQAQKAWTNITPMARRDWVLSVGTVKLSETRKIRIKKTCDMLASGKGRVCCFPGLNWLTKDHVTKEETWLPLSKTTNHK